MTSKAQAQILLLGLVLNPWKPLSVLLNAFKFIELVRGDDASVITDCFTFGGIIPGSARYTSTVNITDVDKY